MIALGRRALGLAALGLGAAEALSLGGAFDHRRAPRATSRAAVRRALATPGDAIVHVGHSTHVLCLGGRRLLTDPWFSDPAFGVLAHASGPACEPMDLGEVDAILVSHEHPDHADLDALDRMPTKNAVVLVGTSSLEAKLRARGHREVRVLAPWETHPLGGVAVHAVPAVHDVPEIGFVVAAGGTSLYFAGDTALHSHLAAIAERFRPTFALLPVDGTRLRGSPHATMNAIEAASAAGTLGVLAVMPSHAEARFTDPFAEHALTTTSGGAGTERFRSELLRALPGLACHVPAPGERVPL